MFSYSNFSSLKQMLNQNESQKLSNLKEKPFLDDVEEKFLFFLDDDFFLFSCFFFTSKHPSLKSLDVQLQLLKYFTEAFFEDFSSFET